MDFKWVIPDIQYSQRAMHTYSTLTHSLTQLLSQTPHALVVLEIHNFEVLISWIPESPGIEAGTKVDDASLRPYKTNLYIGPPIISHGTLLRVQGITINYESRTEILATLPKKVPGYSCYSQNCKSLWLNQWQFHCSLVFIQFNCCFQDKWGNNLKKQNFLHHWHICSKIMNILL